jgi:hypothetical protein
MPRSKKMAAGAGLFYQLVFPSVDRTFFLPAMRALAVPRAAKREQLHFSYSNLLYLLVTNLDFYLRSGLQSIHSFIWMILSWLGRPSTSFKVECVFRCIGSYQRKVKAGRERKETRACKPPCYLSFSPAVVVASLSTDYKTMPPLRR